ncbi:PIN-like domain-containing protein [Streptomyces sp. NPDC021080]|uniref:PIN-like domain-containing protein n=1 Tax=Streptomyces sp. NPDC021080 TaxID=3365110 RepID=UPI0037B36BDC
MRFGGVVGASADSAGRGIFDCDEAYRTPVSSDYERLFQVGLIALDTNVLLNLYRSNERTRKDTFAVLDRLRDRLWVPHQVLVEFWRNRALPSVRGHHHSKAQEVSASLNKASRSVHDALDRWMKDVHLSSDEEVRRRIDSSRSTLNGTLEKLKSLIQEQAQKDAVGGTAVTHGDPILRELEGLLQGRIGEPLSVEEFGKAVREAQSRADSEIPPGYADFQSKSPEQAAGDYILWKQLLDEVEKRKQDVLMVTGDVKEDWWVRRDGEVPARPRKELGMELRQRAGVSLFMMTPSQLLAEANEILGLKVDKRSVIDLALSENVDAQNFPHDFIRQFLPLSRIAHRRAREATEATSRGDLGHVYQSALSIALLRELCREAVAQRGATVPFRGRHYPLIEGNVVIPLACGKHEGDLRDAHVRVGSSARIARAIEYLEASTYSRKSVNGLSEEISAWGESEVKGIAVVAYVANVESGVTVIQYGKLTRIDKGGTTWRLRGEARDTGVISYPM